MEEKVFIELKEKSEEINTPEKQPFERQSSSPA
jgi:hypothetical protein